MLLINSISILKKPMSRTQIKTKQNVSRKYMSLKEIEFLVANPNFGENIMIDINYYADPVSSLFQSSYPDLSRVSNTNSTYAGQSIYTGHSSYLDYNYNYNYNLKPSVFPKAPVYVGPNSYQAKSLNLDYNLKLPVYTVPIPSIDKDSKETSFLKTKKGVFIKIGSNVLIKKTYNQYKICINHKGTVKKIFKINGNWYFFVEIENEEIRKQIIEIHHYLEKNNNKKFKYPFFKDINQEKSWIVIQNKTENFELIESSNESSVLLTVPTSISKPSNSPISKSADHFDAAYFANVNAKIIAAEAISARLKAKSDAFLNVFNTSLASPASKKQKI